MDDVARDGYDRIAEQYAAGRADFDSLPFLERFVALLPEGGSVLDVGCGTGVPTARYLVDHGFLVSGIDISSRMIELAKTNVPKAAFEVRDMAEVRPHEFSVDGIVALYGVFHVDRRKHQGLIGVFRSFLKPGSALLLTMGADEWEGAEANFRGVEIAWSHFGAERNRAMIEAAGFSVELDELDTSAGERHQVVIARLP